MCRKRSSRLGGNFFCAVDDDSKCKDIKKEPTTGISVSVDACTSVNVGKVVAIFDLIYSLKYWKMLFPCMDTTLLFR